MENNEQKFVTVELLDATLDKAFGKFAEDILLPAFQSLSDEISNVDKRVSGLEENMNKKFAIIDGKFEEIQVEVTRHSGEIFKLQESVKKIENSVESID
ncbi:MAG: hypothetical protein WCL61_02590, partial [bacterium]